jgi:hypothetical protein
MEKGRPILNLTESQIRYAMANTYSIAEAAKFLRVAYNSLVKYMDMYRDENGMTLRDMHKKRSRPKKERPLGGRGGDMRYYNNGYKEKLEDILLGLYPEYQPRILRKRLFASNFIPLQCSSCGWTEGRITDGNVPLLIHFADGNWRNKRLENLRLLCFNCYFLQVGSLGHYFQGMTYGPRSKPRWDGKPKGTGGFKGRNRFGRKTDEPDNTTT